MDSFIGVRNEMWTILVVALTFGLSISDVDSADCAKTCYYRHPQIVYCKADVVAKVVIEKYVKEVPYGYDDPGYVIKVKEVSKGGSYAYSLTNLYTECGATSYHPFYEGKIYLVMGQYKNGHLVLNSCDFSISMSEINCYQRKGIFKGDYESNCQCADQIDTADGKCSYEKESLCYNSYAYCKYNDDGHCGWQQFWKFRDC